MLNTKRIEFTLNEKKITKTKLCTTLNIARSTLDAILNGADVRISTLEKIAKALDVPVGYFFDEGTPSPRPTTISAFNHSNAAAGNITLNPSPTSQETQLLHQQIAQLQSQLQDKETIIQLLRSNPHNPQP